MRTLPLAIFLWSVACGPAARPDAARHAPTTSAVTAGPHTPPAGSPVPDGATDFVTLGPGFEYARLALSDTSAPGDHLVRVVRIDPAVAHLAVDAASIGDRFPRVASAWAGEAPVVAVINVSMFRKDLRTSLGFLRIGDHTQNDAWAANQSSLLAIDPRDASLPHARLANLGCDDRDGLVAQYTTVVQSIRMLGCDRANLWAPDERRWSAALTGADSHGRILLLFVRSPYTMHALVDQLVALPLDLVALHYGDGGPPASMFVRAPGFTERNVGSVETGAHEVDDNTVEWPLPNVLIATAGDSP